MLHKFKICCIMIVKKIYNAKRSLIMRIMGIDYGDRRIGVAVTDPLGITAQGVSTVQNRGPEKVKLEFIKLIEEYNPEKIVLGLPKNMDGSLGFRAEATYEFAELLKSITGKEIIFWDERLTTVSAAQILNTTNVRGKDRKNVIDTVSACIILENYMASLK